MLFFLLTDEQTTPTSTPIPTLSIRSDSRRPSCNSNNTLSCSGCLNELIASEEYISALGQEWHSDCFRCSVCDGQLSSWYFEKDGLLFCKDDYWSKFGESCQQCGAVITGPVMVAGDHKFHPECFCCEFCSAFIGDGESYALVERSKLFCGLCYKRQMNPLTKSSSASSKPLHSIRLIEIPWTKDATPGLKLSLDDDVLFSHQQQSIYHQLQSNLSTSPGIVIDGSNGCRAIRISE